MIIFFTYLKVNLSPKTSTPRGTLLVKNFVLPRWWFTIYTCQKGKSMAKLWLHLWSQLHKKHVLLIICCKFLTPAPSLLIVSFNCLLWTSFFHRLMMFMGSTTFTNLWIFFLQCCHEETSWRAPKSRGETHLRVSQSQVAESWDLEARSQLPTLERGRGSS